MRKIAIFGAGGLGREAADFARECGYEEVIFTVDDEFMTKSEIDGFSVIPFSQIKIEEFIWVVAVANSLLREEIIKKIEGKANFATLIHPTAHKRLNSEIGEGAIIGEGVVISINVKIGRHAIILGHSKIGHDCQIGDFVTIAPGSIISGNCKIEKNVFLGANSSVKQGVTIAKNTVVGIGTVVLKNLDEGVYVGNPARKIK